MPRYKEKKRVKHKVVVTVYHPEDTLPETHRPEITFEGEMMTMKTTEMIFHHMRRALRMEKLKPIKEARVNDATESATTAGQAGYNSSRRGDGKLDPTAVQRTTRPVG
jgi:hypothetical protein